MLHYHKFRQDLFDPVVARDVYNKTAPGKGWPDQCPPLRAAQGFGFDLLANFDITFIRNTGHGSGRTPWRVEPDIVLESDFGYAATEDSPATPLRQQYAWFWKKGQTLPHVISDNVYEAIKHQVKISSFLYFRTDPNEIVLMTGIPNLVRPWRNMTAVIETDWYAPANPWNTVIELDASCKKIRIKKGEPLCRIMPLRRDSYFARPMTEADFDSLFARGQKWLASHGRPQEDETSSAPVMDITRTYVKQQMRSRFSVLD